MRAAMQPFDPIRGSGLLQNMRQTRRTRGRSDDFNALGRNIVYRKSPADSIRLCGGAMGKLCLPVPCA